MRKQRWIAVLAAITLIAQVADARGMPVEDFALIDHLGAFHQLSRYSNRKAVVLFVQGNGCPVTPKSLGTLRQLRENFAPGPLEERFTVANQVAKRLQGEKN